MKGMVENSYMKHLVDRLHTLKKRLNDQVKYGPRAGMKTDLVKWLREEIKLMEETLESARKIREDADAKEESRDKV
jgi:hypothetical protein